MTPPLTALDRPNSYIGRSVSRPNAKRLLAGRGRYVTDLQLPRMLHAAFFRSPHAHARITQSRRAKRHRRPACVSSQRAKTWRSSASPGSARSITSKA